MRFRDRAAAGAQLARQIELKAPQSTIIVGVPTGGCIIAREMAAAHSAAAFVVITRKMRCPGAPELAIGAVSPDGHTVLDQLIVTARGLTPTDVAQARLTAETEVNDRLIRYAAHLARKEDVAGRHVIIADDGVATGLTVKAAVLYVLRQGADRVTVATPVIAPEAAAELSRHASVISLIRPANFRAVGQYYLDFEQLTEADALASLEDGNVHGHTPPEER